MVERKNVMETQLRTFRHAIPRYFILLSLLISFIVVNTIGVVNAQTELEPQLVTATKQFDDSCGPGFNIQIQIYNVGSAGGEAYAQAIYTQPEADFTSTGEGITCSLTGYSEDFGTFSGGANGIISFQPDEFGLLPTACQVVDGKTIDCLIEYDLFGQLSSKHLIFTIENPEAFQPTTAEKITSEYIYNTYGLRVQDSVGDENGTAKSWTDHELTLLNDVLKELPPEFLQKIALTNFMRSGVYLESDGTQKPSVMGDYLACDPKIDPDCTGSSATIHIFDNASTLVDFADPDTQFKGSIMHEIMHAYHAYKEENSIYLNVHESPQFQNWIDATKKKSEATTELYQHNNGWGWYQPPGKWQYFGLPTDPPPTNYATTDPAEDYCESTMLYVYDPERLKTTSPERYNYIRDYVFGGVEYANGIRK
jgi:hypothetical protein